jgi:Domain of unknown function (DUF4249)
MKNLITLFASAIFISACTKPLPIEVPQLEPKLVVNCQIIPDQIIVVSLTKSFTGLYDANKDTTSKFDILVPNGFVTISYDNKVDTLNQLSDGFYVSLNTDLKPNTTYKLFAYDSLTKQTVTAETRMMPRAELKDLKFNRLINGTDTSYEVEYSLTDASTQNDYYYVTISKLNKSLNTPAIPPAISKLFFKTTKLFLHPDAQAQNGIIKGRDLLIGPLGFKPGDTVSVLVAQIDEGYFKYLNAFQRSGSVLNQLTGEPINFPTNIKNGYGYFAAHPSKIYLKTL